MQKYKDALEYEKLLIHTKLSCGKSLVELSTYKGVALWWFVHFNFIFLISKPRSLKRTNFSQYQIMIKIPFFHFLRRLCVNFQHMTYYLSKEIIKIIILVFRRDMKRGISNKKKILITGQDIEWRQTTHNKSGKFKNSDHFFKPILDTLRDKNYDLISTYPLIFPYFHSLSILIDKLKTWEIEHIPFDIFYNNSIWQNQKKEEKYFENAWKLVKNDPLFKELINFDNNENSPNLEDIIEDYFLHYFPSYIKIIDMSSYLIEHEKPSLVLIQNEYSGFERALLIAAKLKGVPTLAIQHGVIHEHHSGYIYQKGEISLTGDIKSPHCPIPDKTALYGTYHKELLTNVSAYPKNSVVVTGQPRYDILYHVNEIYNKEQFLKKYNINKNHKIILWTTQCHGISDEENKKNFKAMFESFKNITEVTLIIKQHPGEGKKYTKMIKNALKDYNLNTVIPPKRSDTYEQLYVCDIMVTKNSTTAMEAVALNKPVIVLNLSGEPDAIEYVEEGVALGVYDEKELKPTIEKLLKDDSELAENRDKYIQKYLYKVDGKSTERVVRLIERTLDEQEK